MDPSKLQSSLQPMARSAHQYWIHRPEFLATHHGIWIGFCEEKIVVQGFSFLECFRSSQDYASVRHPNCSIFIERVGHEREKGTLNINTLPHKTIEHSAWPSLPTATLTFADLTHECEFTYNDVLVNTASKRSFLMPSDLNGCHINAVAQGWSENYASDGGVISVFTVPLVVKIGEGWVPMQVALPITAKQTGRVIGFDFLSQVDAHFHCGPLSFTVDTCEHYN